MKTERQGDKMMFGFISKKKLYEEVNKLYWLNHTEKTYSNNDWYYRCGCANICNYLCYKFNLPKLKKSKEGGADEELSSAGNGK